MTAAGLLVAALSPGWATLLASVLWALAVGWVALELVLVAGRRPPDHLLANDSERQRRAELRKKHRFYRWFEPFIDRLAGLNRRLWPRRLERLQQQLELTPLHLWKADEFCALRQLESVAVFPVGVLMGYLFFPGSTALLAGLAVMLGVQELMLRQVSKQAQQHLALIRSRLPYVIDLMALMLESGADFRQALETTVRENEGHPLGEEFGRVATRLQQGASQPEALQAMAQRLQDADVSELVFAINTAEQLGTPLKQTLQMMAEHIRSRRIQWLERAAEEAKVHITWPAVVVMVACLFIVAAPILLEMFSP
jgi:Flp pilus assembly protein TadB